MNQLINTTIFTNEINIKNHMLPGNQYNYSPNFTRETGAIENELDKYYTSLSLSIKNTPEHPFPVDVYIKMTAVFTIKGSSPKSIEQFLKITGVQTLLPYIRSAVTSITSAALMSPIALPLMDVTKMFPEDTAQ